MAAASLAVLAGCGIPTQPNAHGIPSGDVPFNLLSRQPASTTTTTGPQYSTTVTVYFTVTFDHIAGVQRQIPPKVTLTSILNAMLGGPSPVQQTNGYQSAFTRTVRLIRATVSGGGVATVDFNAAFGRISGNFQALAVAQVVYTVTANVHTITGVQFEIGDTPIEVPTPTGAVVAGPVGSQQYQTLLEANTTTTTVPTTAPTTVPTTDPTTVPTTAG